MWRDKLYDIDRCSSAYVSDKRVTMADLEAVLADVSYLMAMERSKAPAAKTIKRLTLPDARSVNSVKSPCP